MASDWLEDFVEHTSYGETPAKIMYWVGVSTIAGALRRKVWIEQFNFQWTPNFYILIVAPPGRVKKSTSIGLGTRILQRVEGIDFGPQSVTWQQLITHMADAKQSVLINDKPFDMSCVTIALSEFGTFFDPADRVMVDQLTDLWDGKIGTVLKETKTNGCDSIVNPWINIIGCTTPGWVADNFSSKLVRSGFASRPIYLYCDKRKKRVAYVSKEIPDERLMYEREDNLAQQLMEMAEYSGRCILTDAAYEWGDAWYERFCDLTESYGNSLEAGLFERGQTHLHKLAIVISAARGKFPIIDVEELIEADARLKELDEDVRQIFGYVGQSPTSKTAQELLEALVKHGTMTKRELYKRFFFRTISSTDFEEALSSAKASGALRESGDLSNPVLELI